MADTEPYKAEFEAWARVECNLPFYAAIDWNQAWTKQAWKIWQASALASRPAEVDDEGLPPLPAHIEVGGEGWDIEDFKSEKTFTVEHLWQYARDAVAADRVRMLTEILYCYSGDDSVCDYQDKISALMAAPSHTTNKEK